MEKTYQPKDVEQKWYQAWEKAGLFTPTGQGTPYTIMLPPPNVTGSLHMGHAFQDTLMDLLIRYHRMLGRNTLWQGGCDHAGIATQIVVERQLNLQGKTRHELGREVFLEKVWEWKKSSGGTITQQLRRMGASIDWTTERFTMDKGFTDAVTDVFIRLFEEGLIYRGQRLVNWDPILQTAISDLEVVTLEEPGTLWHIRYPLASGEDFITVATTRPETLLGDVAVAVHPDDLRYQKWIGQKLLLPIANREIALIADQSVDPTFGTGCVKITPAHDFNDYEVAKRHNLPLINIFTPTICLNEVAPCGYEGLDKMAARKRILQELATLQLLEKEEPYTLKMPRGDRSGVVVEPLLTYQWFVKTTALAEPAIAAVESGRIRFVPEQWGNTYFEWMRNIQDWCISRQIWWGHRIPAWFDENGEVYVAKDEKTVREKYKLSDSMALRQDTDVLDTWFSSALWPFVTLGWPSQTPEFKSFYPTSVLVTGFDIIFFWVARMIMMGLKLTGDVPFREVYIHGLIRDPEGQKMSKSKGNVIDPIDLIDGISLEDLIQKRTEGLMRPADAPQIAKRTKMHFPDGIPENGTDALRFTYCSLASPGRDIRFDLNRLSGYRNFCNKLWNAARYVSLQLEYDPQLLSTDKTLADQWILSLLNKTISAVSKHFDEYRFDLAASALYQFVWNEYCDWYLELSKPILGVKKSNKTVVEVLETILCLLHPVIPFITEEIWQRLGFAKKRGLQSISLAPFPIFNAEAIDESAETEINWIKSWVMGVRNLRGEMNIAPGKQIPVLLENGTSTDRARVEKHEASLKTLAKHSSITWVNAPEKTPPAAIILVGDLRLLCPLSEIIDVKDEQQRLQREILKLISEIKRSQFKLNNAEFIGKAPPQVVQTETEKLKANQNALQTIEQQLKGLVYTPHE